MKRPYLYYNPWRKGLVAKRSNALVCKTNIHRFKSGLGLQMRFIIEFFGKIPVWILIALAAASVIAGDIFAKYWSQNRRLSFFILTLILYAGSGLWYTPTLLRKGLIVTSIAWTITATVGFLIVGMIMFKEHLTGLQIVGTVLGTVAIILLSL